MWIENSNFLIREDDIPRVPLEFSEEAKDFWREMKRRCIEGYTVGGKWMPGNLFFYINFGTILLNKGSNSKTKIPEKPFLRDIEWEIFPAWSVARGLSGFANIGEIGDTHEEVLQKIKEQNTDLGCPIYNNQAKDLIVTGPREFGKASWVESVTYTKDGPKRWGDIKVGDKIYGNDGKLTTVLKVFPQGKQQLFSVTLRDGRTTVCSAEHLWGVYTKTGSKERAKFGNRRYVVMTTKQLSSNYKINRITDAKNPNGFEPKYFIPTAEAIDFTKKELPIDSYTMGLLLGDGCFSGSSKHLANIAMDSNDLNELKQFIPYSIHTLPSSKLSHRIHIENFIEKLNILGLSDRHSEDKFIPKQYLLSSIEDRMNLLRGLMDTDGTVGIQKSQIEYCTVSKQLCNDFMWLCRSLGINCSLSIKKLYTGKTAYRINIFTKKRIFNLDRKQSKITKTSALAKSRIERTAIVNIEYAFTDDCMCVLLDNESHLYLIDDFITTHNSYMAGQGIILHEWIFNGAKEYKPGLNGTTNVIVGAGDLRYATDLISKAKLGYDFLSKAGIMFNGRYYPHPFYQAYDGSFNKEVTAQYKKKVGGKWLEYGSRSKIKVVSYKDNPFAGQGSRNSVMVKEEVGMFKGLIAAQEADVETMREGTNKFGSCLYIGTGGSMQAGTLDLYKMFYDPETYNIMNFDDRWENKGKIGLFISAVKRPNQFKDAEGNTNEEKATEYFLKQREKLKNSKNGANALNAHIQYNPLVPSEVFLRTNVNIFPVAELKDWVSELETNTIYKDAELHCELIVNEQNEIEPRMGPQCQPLREFPITRDIDMTGCVVIYHHPQIDTDGTIPWGRYIGGIDPYDANKSTTTSLGSCLIFDKMSNTLVAEYTGRPKFAEMCWETTRRLLLYYNAVALYENEKPGIKQYFERKGSLHLLMRQPKYIKDVIPNSTVERQYGMHMNQQLKDHGEILLRDWLSSDEDGKLNLRRIRCVPLIHELIMYDETGNYDRVMAAIQCMYAFQELHKQKVMMAEDNSNKIDPFFTKRIFLRR